MEKNIYTKLLDFQKLNISVLKSSKNPHFKSTYANLNEVLDKVKKPLNDMGIIIIFEPQSEGLKTTLHDTESKTEISGYMKYVDCGNAQKLLACNTYYRRGTLVSLLGLEDEDDDGNKASQPQKDLRQDELVLEWQTELEKCKTLDDLTALYNGNKATIEATPLIKALFTKRKTQLNVK